MTILVLCAIAVSTVLITIAYKGSESLQTVGLSVENFSPLGAEATTMFDAAKIGGFWSLFGAIIIFLFYYMRFAQWAEPPAMRLRQKPPRDFTSGSRYTLHASLYALTFVALYFCLITSPSLLKATDVLAASDPSGFLKNLAEKLDDPFIAIPYAVLLVTMILPGVFSKHETRFRKEVQTLAYIPAEAQALVGRLVNNPQYFSPNGELVNELLKGQYEQFLSDKDFSPQGADVLALFGRILYHTACLKKLSSDRNFGLIELRYRDDIMAIEAEFLGIALELGHYRREVLKRAHALLGSGDDSFVLEPDQLDLEDLDSLWYILDLAALDRKDTGIAQTSAHLKNNLERLLEQLYEIIVCTVLALERFPGERKPRFRLFGLSISERNRFSLSRSTIIALGATVLIACAVPTILYKAVVDNYGDLSEQLKESTVAPANIGMAFSWIVTGMAMHLSAVFVAVLAKRSIDNKRLQQKGESTTRRRREIADYFDASALAFTVNLFILLIFSRLNHQPLTALSENWVWAFVPAVTAGATIWHLDSYWFGKPNPWFGAAWQATATALMAGVICWVSRELGLLTSFEFGVLAIYTMVVTGLIGGSLGYWFPLLYSRQQKQLGEYRERRSSIRTEIQLEGRWSCEEARQPLGTIDISSSGCRVAMKLDEAVGTIGRIAIADTWESFAQIVRQDDEETALRFLPDEGWRRLEHCLIQEAA